MVCVFPIKSTSLALQVKECQRLQEEDKLQFTEVAAVQDRMEKVTNGFFAETEHFHRERCHDFKGVMRHYLHEQVAFHQEIINKLGANLAMYDNIVD